MLWLHKPQILYQWANGLADFKVASVVGWVRLVSYVMVYDLERFLTLIGWLDQKISLSRGLAQPWESFRDLLK